MTQPNSRHGGPGQFDRVGMAAVAHAERSVGVQ